MVDVNENRAGYRKTKVGWIPEEWKVRNLSEVAKKPIVYGIVQAGPDIPEGIPYIKSSDISGKKIQPENLQRTSLEIAKKYQRSEVCPGDVIFSLRGNIGICQIVPDELKTANLTQGTARIRCKDDCNNRFVLYVINSFSTRNRIFSISKGSTFKEVTLNDLRKIKIPLPPLPEQKRMATILSTWDAAINKLDQLIAQKKQLKKGLMQQLLTGQVRFPEFVPAGGTRYKETKVGRIPEDWEVRRLDTVSKFLDHKRRPIKEADRARMQGEYPYYGASGIIDYVNDYIFDEELILLGEDGANIVMRSTPLVFKVSGKIWVNNHAHVLKPNNDMDITFLTDYLESLNYNKYNTGSAQPKLNKEVCKKIEILKPSFPEQRYIAGVLSNSDKEIESLEQQKHHLQLQKKGLMQQLLTGAIRVKTD